MILRTSAALRLPVRTAVNAVVAATAVATAAALTLPRLLPGQSATSGAAPTTSLGTQLCWGQFTYRATAPAIELAKLREELMIACRLLHSTSTAL